MAIHSKLFHCTTRDTISLTAPLPADTARCFGTKQAPPCMYDIRIVFLRIRIPYNTYILCTYVCTDTLWRTFYYRTCKLLYSQPCDISLTVLGVRPHVLFIHSPSPLPLITPVFFLCLLRIDHGRRGQYSEVRR